MRGHIQDKLFLVSACSIPVLLRTWGLLDEYLAGRFTACTVVAIISIWSLKSVKDFKINIFDLFFLIYSIYSIFTIIWSISPAAGYFQAGLLTISLVFYMLFRLLDLSAHMHWIRNSLLILGGILSAMIIYQYIAKTIYNEGNLYDIIGLSGHKNLVSSFLFILIGLTTYYIRVNGMNTFSLVIVFMQIICLALLKTRAVYAALLFISVSYLIHWLFSKRAVFLSIVRSAVSASIILLISGTILYFSFKPKIQGTEAERLFVWIKTIELIKDHPILGAGLGNWKIVFPSHNVEGSYRIQSQNVIFTRAHNDYLEVWTETGVLGLTLYLSIFISLLYFLNKKTDQDSDYKIKFHLAQVLLGFMIIAFFDFPKERVEHQIFLSLVFALAVSHCTEMNAGTFFQFNLNTFHTKLIATLPVVLALVIGTYTIKGEWNTRKAMEAQVKTNWAEAEKWSKKAYSTFYHIDPIATSIKWREGLNQYQQGKFTEAKMNFEMGLKATPYHYQSMGDYASCLVQLKEYDKAIGLLEECLRINPRYEEAMFNIAYALTQVKKYDQALEWVNKVNKNIEKKNSFIAEIQRLQKRN